MFIAWNPGGFQDQRWNIIRPIETHVFTFLQINIQIIYVTPDGINISIILKSNEFCEI